MGDHELDKSHKAGGTSLPMTPGGSPKRNQLMSIGVHALWSTWSADLPFSACAGIAVSLSIEKVPTTCTGEALDNGHGLLGTSGVP